MLTLAAPTSALSCSSRIVDVGDPASRVRTLCGEPTQISARTESRTSHVAAGGRRGRYGESVTVTTEVELWVYDRGPRRFVQEITIANGRVRSISARGYGTTRGRAAIEPDATFPRHRARVREEGAIARA